MRQERESHIYTLFIIHRNYNKEILVLHRFISVKKTFNKPYLSARTKILFAVLVVTSATVSSSTA